MHATAVLSSGSMTLGGRWTPNETVLTDCRIRGGTPQAYSSAARSRTRRIHPAPCVCASQRAPTRSMSLKVRAQAMSTWAKGPHQCSSPLVVKELQSLDSHEQTADLQSVCCTTACLALPNRHHDGVELQSPSCNFGLQSQQQAFVLAGGSHFATPEFPEPSRNSLSDPEPHINKPRMGRKIS